jgi:[ribosomal protein S5]-alanine N-acetyltransferase
MNGKNQQLRVKGPTVFLRYPENADAAEFTALSQTSAAFHRNLVNPPKDEKAFAAFVERNAARENEFLLVCRNADRRIAGTVNLSQIFRLAFQNCYLGYYLFAPFTGTGLMTEAVGLALRHAFLNLRLHRVEANVQPENTASLNVLRRCGFTKEGFSRKYLKIGGRWRDHERWAILKEDWRKN